MLDRHHARVDQFQVVEETHNLTGLAHPVGVGTALVVLAQRVVLPRIRVRSVVDRQVAAGWQGGPERTYDRLGDPVVIFFRVTDMAEDAHQHDGDRTAEVKLFPGSEQQRVWVVEVGVDVVGAAFSAASEHRPGVRKDERIVVHVDDPGVRGYPLGGLVGAVVAGQPGADVKELPDPRLTRQVTDHPGDEITGHAGQVEDTWKELRELIPRLLVDRIVILAA
jgi:hypothetical protein